MIVKSDKHRERIASIVNYIDKHYKEDLSNEKLSEIFNISSGYLSRLFKDHLNTTVKSYVSNIRLKNAVYELMETDYAVTDIALNNGFPNLQSFYQVFRKNYAMTPMQYRKNKEQCFDTIR